MRGLAGLISSMDVRLSALKTVLSIFSSRADEESRCWAAAQAAEKKTTTPMRKSRLISQYAA